MAHAVHLQHHLLIGLSLHDGFQYIPFPPIPNKFIYLSVFQLDGWNNWQSFRSTRVIGPGEQHLMAKSTDAGILIPHFPILPTPFDLLFPLHMLFSSSVSMLGSMNVIVEAQSQWTGSTTAPVAVCWWPCAPFSQNIACNDPIEIPTDFVISPDSIEVQITCWDVVAMVMEYAMQVAMSMALQYGGAKVKKAAKGRWAKRQAAKKGAAKVKKLKKMKMPEVAGEGSFWDVPRKSGKKMSKEMQKSADDIAEKELRKQREHLQRLNLANTVGRRGRELDSSSFKKFFKDKAGDESHAIKNMFENSLGRNPWKNMEWPSGWKYADNWTKPLAIKYGIGAAKLLKFGVWNMGIKRAVTGWRPDYQLPVWTGNLTPEDVDATELDELHCAIVNTGEFDAVFDDQGNQNEDDDIVTIEKRT